VNEPITINEAGLIGGSQGREKRGQGKVLEVREQGSGG